MYTVIGIRHRDNDYQGKLYHNHYLHCTREDKNVEGVAVEMLSFEGNFDSKIVLGATVEANYNKWGKITSVKVV